MKVAYILDKYPSLSETFIAREIDALRRCGFDIQVWAMQAGEGAQALPSGDWKAAAGKIAAKLGGPAAQQKYFQALGVRWWQQNHDQLRNVQHVHAGWASFPAEIAWGAAEFAGLPWSFSGHARDIWVDGGAWPEKLLHAKFASVCTRAGQKFLAQQAPESAAKVLYVPHGLELVRFPFMQHEIVRNQPLRVLCVGRLVEKKGFSVLLRALSQLQQQDSDFYAVIIGEGPQRPELEAQVIELHLQDRVQLVGAQSAEEVLENMYEADCLVVPSIISGDGDRDGLPNVLLEAAACGLPIIASTAGSITDFLDYTCARLCEPEDAAALAEALRDVVEDTATTIALAQAARERVEMLFDIHQNIQLLAEAFRNR
jgi:colanic acid/amylovoran biosynthesis glycosyltransferase